MYGCTDHLLDDFYAEARSVWSFMFGLQKDKQQPKDVFLQGTAGVEHPESEIYHTIVGQYILFEFSYLR